MEAKTKICNYCGGFIEKPLTVGLDRWESQERYFCSKVCGGLDRLSHKVPSYLSLFMLDRGITPIVLRRALCRYREVTMPQLSKLIIEGVNPLWSRDGKVLAKAIGAAISDIVGMDDMGFGGGDFDYRRVLRYHGGGWIGGEKGRKETSFSYVVRVCGIDLCGFMEEQMKGFYYDKNRGGLIGDDSYNLVRNCVDVLGKLQKVHGVVYSGSKWRGVYDLLTRKEGYMTAKAALGLSRVMGLMSRNIDYRELMEPVLPHQYGVGLRRELVHIKNEI